MPAPRRTAVSYSRFSDPKQAGGDSAERQERLYREFCERHDLSPGKEVFADRGRSGYHGEHRTRGRLGQLIDAAKDGRFDPGTVIVIEAWDRLGRLRPDRQTELVAELLRTGVSIGVCRLNDIFTEDDFGSHKWTTLAVFIQLAHQESKQKAERVAASWQRRRELARGDGRLIGASLPAWVEVVNGEPRLIPDRAATVRKIFALAADGIGHTRIVRTLVKEKVLPFGRRVVREGRTRSQFSGTWTKPYVALLLRDRRTLGELQLYKGGNPDGPPMSNYYPPCISEEEFALARAAQERRSNRDKLGRASGPRQGKYVNVFKSLLTHARDGDGMHVHNKGTRKRPELLLLNGGGVAGQSARTYTFPYLLFEEKVLGLIREIDPADILKGREAGASVAESLRAKIANCRQDIANLKRDLKGGYSKALAEVLREAESTEEELVNQLQDELAKSARPAERVWGSLPSLIDVIRDADDPDAARLRVRAALRSVVESGWVLIVPHGAWRLLVLQLDFTGGATRHFLISYRSAANRRVAAADAKTFATPGRAPLDLRRPADAAKLEKALLKAARRLT